jgi:hypothetical protein
VSVVHWAEVRCWLIDIQPEREDWNVEQRARAMQRQAEVYSPRMVMSRSARLKGKGEEEEHGSEALLNNNKAARQGKAVNTSSH